MRLVHFFAHGLLAATSILRGGAIAVALLSALAGLLIPRTQDSAQVGSPSVADRRAPVVGIGCAYVATTITVTNTIDSTPGSLV